MTRTRLLLAGLLLLTPVAARAQGAGDDRAKELAQQILNDGAALFDTRDAGAMAATYVEDAQVFVVSKDQDSGRYKIETRSGRAEIEALYRDVFKDGDQRTTSRNRVKSACQVAADLLLIEGDFTPNTSSEGRYPFVQVRVKQGDAWRIQSLRLFLIPVSGNE